jgi:hypothetical protein
MPELAPIGTVRDPDQFEPIVVPVVAQNIRTGKEIVEKFTFRPIITMGVQNQLEQHATTGRDMTLVTTVACLKTLIMDEKEQSRWTEFVDRQDLALDAQTITDVFIALVEHYGERPTRPSSASSSSGGRSGRTSKAARSSKA